MATWRLLHTWDADPALQMGFDELLLESRDAPPTLRFYTWEPDALSLGYFQRLADVPRAREAGRLVRRQTGGGAIHHVHELTFALAAAQDEPVFAGAIALSYERVHGALARAFRELGVDARLARDVASPLAPLVSDQVGTGMCFHASTPLDLVWDHKKGVGSAQRRTGGRVLHHGSIKLAASDLDTQVAELGLYAPELTPATLAGLVASELARAFGWELAPAEATRAELDEARRRGRRFAAPEFVARR